MRRVISTPTVLPRLKGFDLENLLLTTSFSFFKVKW
ncbi:hypothetical protein OROGR_005547 [Orobanche gracilis]